MRILSLGLFLLLGACLAADRGPKVENFGGDIDSPYGRSLLVNASSGAQSKGFNSWKEDFGQKIPSPGAGDSTNFHENETVSVFLGAPLPAALRNSELIVGFGFYGSEGRWGFYFQYERPE